MTKVQVRDLVRAELHALGEPEVTDEWIEQLYVRVLLLQALGFLAYQPDRQAFSGYYAALRSLRKPTAVDRRVLFACVADLAGGVRQRPLWRA